VNNSNNMAENKSEQINWENMLMKLYIMAARSKAQKAFTHWNTEIEGLNPSQGMDVCVYSVFVFCVGSGLVMGWSLVQGVLPAAYRIRNFRIN
jgi:hypothetical protein